MNNIILDLNEHDAHKILWLVQKEAAESKVFNGYWERLANQISAGIEAQAQARAKGLFFQCSACREEAEECQPNGSPKS
jgi:glutathionylspermidine synthase